jgi:RNAse (barnase) inhibitor barstar
MDDDWAVLPPPVPKSKVVKKLPDSDKLFEEQVIWMRNASWATVHNELPVESGRLCIKVCDCRDMKNERDLFAGLAQILDFPDWFGWNWDALEDLLGDLDWIEKDLVLVIKSAQTLRAALRNRYRILVPALYYVTYYAPDTSRKFAGGWRRCVVIQSDES